MTRAVRHGPAMTPALLVSVRDADEAALARASGAHLVDAKDPARGALGALSPELVAAIAAAARSGRDPPLVSAVAGEPRTIAAVAECLRALAASAVDFLKVAVHPDWCSRPEELRGPLGEAQAPVIAVLFAEDRPDDACAPALALAGFAGAMIDTRVKDGRRLPDLLPPAQLARFVEGCRDEGLVSGLAGSLALGDIPGLARCGPDYLGFRGGLCRAGDRGQELDPDRIREAVRLLAPGRRLEAA